jgi:hypothetical protein
VKTLDKGLSQETISDRLKLITIFCRQLGRILLIPLLLLVNVKFWGHMGCQERSRENFATQQLTGKKKKHLILKKI